MSNQIQVECLDFMGSDLTVANAARVSMDKWHDDFWIADAKLIAYLAKHKHWTPFGQPQIQMRITAPIFVARQAFKSTVGTIRNEVSRRYVDTEPEFYFPDEWRARPEENIKQGSGDGVDTHIQYKAELMYDKAVAQCKDAYKALLFWGVAPEMARMVLPQSMMTQWVETGSLSYWARFYGLRSDAHAQVEIQEVARQVGAIVADLFPICWKALTNQEKTV